jgi:hypothetical protein
VPADLDVRHPTLGRAEPAPEPAAEPAAPRPWLRTGALALVPGLVMFGLGTHHPAQRGMWGDEYAMWQASHIPLSDLFHLLSRFDAVLAPYY